MRLARAVSINWVGTDVTAAVDTRAGGIFSRRVLWSPGLLPINDDEWP